ncbi:F-type H+-transporting ATPase subunit b [Humitalea rosea]|uniref:ATP synthase subunit b n=1 Tax=Humitalea rosea TaxID=990373 RepID=A0A2W7HZI1_9PROT|nr:F0F1 ATP synthase subunit delta [Humitalea rosea]PZW39339.1 F-type H+-transporting ATPase subunit b [Humitalea rosea]
MQIDWWTFGLQTINVLVLIWLLQRFLFRPVKAIIDARRDASEKLLADAEAARNAAQEAVAAIEARRKDFSKEGEAILAAAQATALTERANMLEQARQEAARIETEAHKILARERETQRHELEAQAGELAVVMARRLLDLLPADTVTAALLEALAQDLAALPAEARRELAAAERPVVVTTATALSADAQTAWQERLTQLLGKDARFTFGEDPGLIAGATLQGPHTLLRRNWRADLDRLGRSLTMPVPPSHE